MARLINGLNGECIMSAKHFDAGKLPLDQVPGEALDAMAEGLAFGEKKYGKHNWRLGMNWSQLIGSAMRHIRKFNAGVDLDDESGLPHLSHALTCIAFLCTYQRSEIGVDDRYMHCKASAQDIPAVSGETDE